MNKFIALLFSAAVKSWGLFIPLEYSVLFNENSHAYDFTITFNRPSEFFSADSFNRPATSFQYYIDYEAAPGFQSLVDADVIVRGDEIQFENKVVVRDRTGAGGENSGGWGPVRGMVDFTLDGKRFSFSIPVLMLGDADGAFTYTLETFEFGETQSTNFGGVEASIPPIPEPGTAALFLAGLLGMGGWGLREVKKRP